MNINNEITITRRTTRKERQAAQEALTAALLARLTDAELKALVVYASLRDLAQQAEELSDEFREDEVDELYRAVESLQDHCANAWPDGAAEDRTETSLDDLRRELFRRREEAEEGEDQ